MPTDQFGSIVGRLKLLGAASHLGVIGSGSRSLKFRAAKRRSYSPAQRLSGELRLAARIELQRTLYQWRLG